MIVYLITCSVDQKKYIGVTSRTMHARWKEHLRDAQNGRGWALHDALRLYGPDAFEITIIDCPEAWEKACLIERQLIAHCGSLSPRGFNLTDGGEGAPGRKHSIETRQKIAKAHKGKKLSAEHRKKLSDAKKGKKMKARTASHSAKISEGLKRAWARRKANS